MKIKEMVEAATDVYERVKAMDDSKMKDPLKKQVEAVLSTLNDCKKLEAKGQLSFYDAIGELNSIGKAAIHLQKSVNATSDNFQIPVSKSAIQFFKRKRAEGKVESFIQDLEAATDKLNTLIPWEKGKFFTFTCQILYWEHTWSSGTVQDAWSLAHQCCEFKPGYGQRFRVLGQGS